MTKKQILFLRIVIFTTSIFISGIFLLKGLSIKNETNNIWIQWIFACILVWLLILNYISYLLLNIKYIYKKYFVISKKTLSNLKIKLIIYLLINFFLQLSVLILLIFAYFFPQNIGLRKFHKINHIIFIVFTVFISINMMITPMQGWRKYIIKNN